MPIGCTPFTARTFAALPVCWGTFSLYTSSLRAERAPLQAWAYTLCAAQWQLYSGFALLTTKIVSLGSLAAALTVVVLSIVFFAGDGNIFVVAALSIAMGIIVFAKHKDTIKRLIRGEEKKLTIGGKKNG